MQPGQMLVSIYNYYYYQQQDTVVGLHQPCSLHVTHMKSLNAPQFHFTGKGIEAMGKLLGWPRVPQLVSVGTRISIHIHSFLYSACIPPHIVNGKVSLWSPGAPRSSSPLQANNSLKGSIRLGPHPSSILQGSCPCK